MAFPWVCLNSKGTAFRRRWTIVLRCFVWTNLRAELERLTLAAVTGTTCRRWKWARCLDSPSRSGPLKWAWGSNVIPPWLSATTWFSTGQYRLESLRNLTRMLSLWGNAVAALHCTFTQTFREYFPVRCNSYCTYSRVRGVSHRRRRVTVSQMRKYTSSVGRRHSPWRIKTSTAVNGLTWKCPNYVFMAVLGISLSLMRTWL